METPIEHERVLNSSKAAFWATLLFIVLIITALNFVKSNSGGSHASDTTPAHEETLPVKPANE